MEDNVYDISELIDELKNVETQMSEIVSLNSDLSDNFNQFMLQSLDNQTNDIILNMLSCGLLGIIIGICFVNIFKSR